MGANNSRVLCEDCKRFFKVEGMSSSDVENALKNADFKPRCKECAKNLHTYSCSVCKTLFKKPAIIPANSDQSQGEDKPPPQFLTTVCDRCAGQMKTYVCSICKSIFQKPPISSVDTRPVNEAQGEDEPPTLEVQQSPKDSTVCDSCIKVQKQVMCRNCGVYYLAYEYNRDKKQRGDNGDSATTDVKDKGGTCAKCAAQQRELLNKGKLQMLAVTDEGGAKCMIGTANAFDERYMKYIGYHSEQPSNIRIADTNNSEEPSTS